MNTELSFPIGKYNPPTHIERGSINQWIKEIGELPDQMRQAVMGLTEDQLNTPYRPGGWTVRQVVHHVPDSHLNSYARFHWTLTEQTPIIKAYDEKGWAKLSYQDTMPIEVSLNLLSSVHERWTYLLKALSEEQLDMSFVHPDDGQAYSLRFTIGNYAWHGKHHLAHITALKKRMGW